MFEIAFALPPPHLTPFHPHVHTVPCAELAVQPLLGDRAAVENL